MDYSIQDITALMVVYKTKDLVVRSYESIRKFYPTLKLMIIDNSGGDECTKYLEELFDKDPFLQLIKNEKNEGHGSSVHQGIGLIETDLVLMMDSDTEVVSLGGIEGMLDLMTPEVYGVGKIIKTDLGGRNVPDDFNKWETIDFLLLSVGLINKNQYYNFSQFTRFGLINFKANREINQKGLSNQLFKEFPILGYIHHYPGGTRAKYGDCEDIVEGFNGDPYGELD